MVHALTEIYFPLNVAYAITIHKSQELPLKFIDVDDSEFAAGLTNVVLSRVKTHIAQNVSGTF